MSPTQIEQRNMRVSHLLEDQTRVTAEDVLRFRREVFSDGVVTLGEAETLFAINNHVEMKTPAWNEFFVEALTDYTVNQAHPRGYVSEDNANWLIAMVSEFDVVANPAELELVVKIIQKAQSVPDSLVSFAMHQVEVGVLEGEGALSCGGTLKKGVIGEAETELLRRIMFGYGGNSGIAISRCEAEILFNLDEKSNAAENSAAWNDLFVKCVANHLMAAVGYAGVNRAEALRREAWLDDTSVDVAGTLAKSLRGIGSVLSAATWSDVFKSDHDRMQDAWAERNRRFSDAADQARMVEEHEADWVAERIGRDGVVSPNEKALVEFLQENSNSVHPNLQKLLEKVA